MALVVSSYMRVMPERAAKVATFTLARLGAAAMLFIAVGDLPYSYYTITRFAVCVVAGYGAFLASERQHQRWMWALGLTALLFNPFVPVRLDRSTWAVLDVATGLLILASLSNRALVHPPIAAPPPAREEPKTAEKSVKDSPSVTELNTSDEAALQAKAEAVAQREIERSRRAEENERFRKWQERAYKK
jgi:hypothetical protein